MILILLISLFPTHNYWLGVRVNSITDLPHTYSIQFGEGKYRWTVDFEFNASNSAITDSSYDQHWDLMKKRITHLYAYTGFSILFMGKGIGLVEDKKISPFWGLNPDISMIQNWQTIEHTSSDSGASSKTTLDDWEIRPGIGVVLGFEVGDFVVFGKRTVVRFSTNLVHPYYNRIRRIETWDYQDEHKKEVKKTNSFTGTLHSFTSGDFSIWVYFRL